MLILPGTIYAPARFGNWAAMFPAPPPPPPPGIPLADGVLASPFADLTTEGSGNHYYYNGTSYGSFASLLSAISGTFARSAAGLYYNSSGVVASALSNVLRFGYDPVSLAALGGVLEGARTNVQLNSNAIAAAGSNNTGWGQYNLASMTGNTGTAPDGTATDNLLIPNTSVTYHGLPSSATLAQNSTVSGFVMRSGATGYDVALRDNNTGSSVNFSLSGAGSVLGTGTSWANPGIFKLQDGHYFIWATYTRAASVSAQLMIAAAGTVGDPLSHTYAGDGTSGMYFWGVQIEAGLSPSSLIVTTGTTATRDLDAEARTRTSPTTIAKLLSARTPVGVATEQIVWSADDGTTNNRLRATYKSGGHLHVIVTTGGVDQCDLDMGAVAVNTDFKLAFRLAANDFSASLNGGAVVTDTSGTMPSGVVNDRLGKGLTAGNEWFSTIKQDAEWATASNSALVSLST